jgi:murein DD-endopeptidase MepM/ murein hydrolase activator NlpD
VKAAATIGPGTISTGTLPSTGSGVERDRATTKTYAAGASLLPDPRRPLRRLTKARPISRAFTHVMVIGLVAFSSAFAIGAAGSSTTLDLVASARGAAAVEQSLDRTARFELIPGSTGPDPDLSRAVPRFEPTAAPTPLPTPVAPPPTPAPRAAAKAPAARPQVVVGTGVLAWPVAGGSISQYFSSWHPAIDIAAPYGTAVVAADGGVVTWAGWRNNGGGLVVQIDHGNGIVTTYNHLGSMWVGPGQTVAKGEGIAAVGCTGLCTGPHVHFETIVGGVIVNPLRYL